MTEEEPRLLLGEDAIQQAPALMSRMLGGPPLQVSLPGRRSGWLVTGYEDVKATYFDPRISRDRERVFAARANGGSGCPVRPQTGGASAEQPDVEGRVPTKHLLFCDPPDHTRLRRLVNKAFTPRAVDRLRPRVEEIAAGLVEAMAGKDTVDVIKDLGIPLTIRMICGILGIPEEQRPDFWRWSEVFNGTGATPETLVATGDEATAYFAGLIEAKRACPGDDVISELIAGVDGDDRLTDRELISTALLLVIAGHDTTVNLIGNAVLALLDFPDQQALVRAEPALVDNAVEETLRYDCPVNVSSSRWTSEPITLGGVPIPAHAELLVSVLAANRDPARHDSADRFDVTRAPSEHLAFGYGIHYCLGAPLARMEASIALRTLLARFPRLALAVPRESLMYRASTLFHGVESLPVRVG